MSDKEKEIKPLKYYYLQSQTLLHKKNYPNIDIHIKNLELEKQGAIPPNVYIKKSVPPTTLSSIYGVKKL